MNVAPAKIEAGRVRPFNALAAYDAEREQNRRLWEILSNVLFVADGMAGKLERLGVDVTHGKAILAKAREERMTL